MEQGEDDQEHIDRHILNSSWLSIATYDNKTQTLDLTTTSGRTYTLEGVPPDVVENFVNAPSIGQYFNTYLKGKY